MQDWTRIRSEVSFVCNKRAVLFVSKRTCRGEMEYKPLDIGVSVQGNGLTADRQCALSDRRAME